LLTAKGFDMNDDDTKPTIEEMPGPPGPGIQLPFRVDYDQREGGAHQILNGAGQTVCFISTGWPDMEYQDAYAEFIVEACNNHDRLAAAVAAFRGTNPSDVHLIDDSNAFWNRIEEFRSDPGKPLTITEQRELAEWWAENMVTISRLDETNCRQADEINRLQAMNGTTPNSQQGTPNSK